MDDVDERGAPSTYATVAGMDFYRITRTYPDKMGERWVILLVQSGNYMRREARKDGKRPSVRTFRTPQAAAAALVGRPS